MENQAEKIAPNQNIPEMENLGINDRLALIGLIEEGVRLGSSDTPVVSDLFDNLWELVDKTVSGSKVDHLKTNKSEGGFSVFEVNADNGENLGRLNMIYLKKPLPCYYLVYVEIAAPFRNKGLGNRILKHFGNFLNEKSAIGILDNIIPQDDPTFDIYLKNYWRPAEEITGMGCEDGVYMIYTPTSMQGKDIKASLTRALHHIKRKRATIDMRDNELMVRRTIEEFKDLYAGLMTYFSDNIANSDPVMRFMFTRYVTKLLGFGNRIRKLIGYTGGESLGQIQMDSAITSMRMQSYAPKNLASKPSFHSGDRELWLKLPEALKKHPARIIESLPNYRRPRLVSWMKEKGLYSSDALTIGDLMELGFDPTRLKEITIEGADYIFERVQIRLLPQLREQARLLKEAVGPMAGKRVNKADFRVNPPLLVIRDRGNGYVLRKKVNGIHWEEAVEELKTNPSMKELNSTVNVDRIVKSTVKKTITMLKTNLTDLSSELNDFTFFVSWDLDVNRPKLIIDFSGSSLETIWIA